MKKQHLVYLIFCFFTIWNGGHPNAQSLYQEKALSLGINHSYIVGQSGGGVSFVDFNGDGLDDLTFGTADGDLIHFYRNTGNGFVRNPPLNGNNTEHKQLFWIDYDNDGDKDLFICSKGDVNRLYQNKGNLVLEDITFDAGLPDHKLITFNACWADFNRDGWLDLFLSERVSGNQPENKNYLFYNNADGTFSDVSSEMSAIGDQKLPFSSTALDYNKDKWPDIYIASDRNWGNVLLKNIAGTDFIDISTQSNTDYAIDGMSVALADVNRDSWIDMYISNTPAGNLLFINSSQDNENERVFEERAEEYGVGFYGTAWGSNFLDANNDMLTDLYVSGSDSGSDAISSAFFLNMEDSFQLIKEGFEKDTVISYANAIGDYNSDGFYDIAVLNHGTNKSFLFENQTNENNFVKIKLEGVLSNRDGIGAGIELYAGNDFTYYYTHSGIGFLAQNSENYCFGLKSYDIIDSLIIEWPTGHIDRFYNLEANQQLEILEGSSTNGDISVDDDIEIKEGNFTSEVIENTQNTFRIFPNPARNWVQLVHPERTKTFEIDNLLGEKIISGKINPASTSTYIELIDLSTGIYFIKISDGNKSNVRKIEVIH